MKNAEKREIIYIILIIILVIFIFILLFGAYVHYVSLKNHKTYLKQPSPKIETWMTLGSVIKRFNIPQNILVEKLKISGTLIDSRLTIDKICKDKHLNCTEVVNELNSLSLNNNG